MIGRVVVDRVDEIGVHEFLDGHHRRAFDLRAVQILVAQYEILVLAEFVAFDEAAALQLLASLGILCDDPDAVASVWIDQVEPDRSPVMARVIERHRA